mmetsp:Transcript_35830/g.112431  ORF Transcript_35830/g.112431 Transcript_35830/m.112431 type:complete len:791 (+) Transcript_35830:3253-5625(+)
MTLASASSVGDAAVEGADGAEAPGDSGGAHGRLTRQQLLGRIAPNQIKVKEKERHPWMLSGRSRFRRLYNMFLFFGAAYLVLVVPVRVAVGQTQRDRAWGLVVTLLDIAFMLDVIMNFRTTTITSTGEEITDPKEVALDYLYGWFIFDITTAFPYHLFTDKLWVRLMGPLRIVRASRVVAGDDNSIAIPKAWKDTSIALAIEDFTSSSAGDNMMSGLRLLLVISVVCHVMSCIWIYLGYNYAGDYGSWIEQFSATVADIEGNTLRTYLTALYWAISTVTTAGYGDVLPQSDEERIFCIACLVIGGALYGFVIATMASKVASADINAKHYWEKMDALKSYMSRRSFPDELRRKVQRYYKRYYAQRTALDEEAILRDLSVQLRQEVAIFLIDDLVSSIPLFQGLDPSHLAKVLGLLKPMQLEAQEVVIQAGSTTPQDMYILISGALEVVVPSNGKAAATLGPGAGDKVVATLGPGACVGEMLALELETVRSATIRCATPCDLYSIGRDEIFNAFENMPEAILHMQRRAMEKAAAQNADFDEVVAADPEIMRGPLERQDDAKTPGGGDAAEGGAGASAGAGRRRSMKSAKSKSKKSRHGDDSSSDEWSSDDSEDWYAHPWANGGGGGGNGHDGLGNEPARICLPGNARAEFVEQALLEQTKDIEDCKRDIKELKELMRGVKSSMEGLVGEVLQQLAELSAEQTRAAAEAAERAEMADSASPRLGQTRTERNMERLRRRVVGRQRTSLALGSQVSLGSTPALSPSPSSPRLSAGTGGTESSPSGRMRPSNPGPL